MDNTFKVGDRVQTNGDVFHAKNGQLGTVTEVNSFSREDVEKIIAEADYTQDVEDWREQRYPGSEWPYVLVNVQLDDFGYPLSYFPDELEHAE